MLPGILMATEHEDNGPSWPCEFKRESFSMKKIVVYSELPAAQLERLRERFDVTYFDGVTEDNDAAFAGA